MVYKQLILEGEAKRQKRISEGRELRQWSALGRGVTCCAEAVGRKGDIPAVLEPRGEASFSQKPLHLLNA